MGTESDSLSRSTLAEDHVISDTYSSHRMPGDQTTRSQKNRSSALPYLSEEVKTPSAQDTHTCKGFLYLRCRCER